MNPVILTILACIAIILLLISIVYSWIWWDNYFTPEAKAKRLKAKMELEEDIDRINKWYNPRRR